MVAVPLKGLHIVRSKGRAYYYAWRGGPRLLTQFGTPEFHSEFAATKSPLANVDGRKFQSWIIRYRASDEFAGLANSTKRTWTPWFDAISEEFGDLSARQFDRPEIRVDIKHWRDRWKHAPRAADTGKQVLSRILSYAVAEGGLTKNICEGLPNIYKSNRSDIIWRKEDIDKICSFVSTEIGWVVKLASLTGLRQGDLLTLKWDHISDLAIEMPTSKSQRRKGVALIPVGKELRSLLKSIPRRADFVLTNSRSLGWTAFFSSTWDAAMKKSGLVAKGLHFHDLRGTAATNLFRANMTVREIAEILSWSEARVERLIDRYVKRDEILRDRIRKVDELVRNSGRS